MTESDPAETVFAAWALRRESGEAADFEAVCAAHPQLEHELRRLHANFELIEAPLADHRAAAGTSQPEAPSSTRYRVDREVGKGGMGTVYEVFDRELHRTLAMKVMITSDAIRRARFTEEARVTAQLDHPGIVPIHELGVDDHGHVFFTMKLVRGETLDRVFEKVRTGADGWNLTRAISVLVRVAESIAFAHEKSVIHRDLKPANIMVGRFGETYVMDWGLARVGSPHVDSDGGRPMSARGSAIPAAVDSARDRTSDGDLLGTPAYMAPEQAAGRLAAIGPRSDVYAVGAMLYRLLAGRPPFPQDGLTPIEVARRVVSGRPEPLERKAPTAPPELVAICNRAMAREPALRYPTMLDLADDFRAYLERRVVRAFRTGAIAELTKWTQRNRGTAAAILIGILGLSGLAWSQFLSRKAAEQHNRDVTEARDDALARKHEFDQLAGVVYLETALAREKELYPAWPDKIPAMEKWLAEDAATLIAMKPVLIETIAELEAQAIPQSDAEREADRAAHPRRAELEAKSNSLAWLNWRLAVVASGSPPPIPPLPPHLAASSAFELNEFAQPRVRSSISTRVFGEEGISLAAARTAVQRIELGDGSLALHTALDTLAWAFAVNGRDTEAREASQRALAIVPEMGKVVYGKSASALEAAIADWSGDGAERSINKLVSMIDALEKETSQRQTWRFKNESQRFLHSTLRSLLIDSERFESSEVKDVERRLAWAKRIGDLTLHHPNARVTWAEARDAIVAADGVVASSLYRDAPIDLRPQWGLVPIGMNPSTKLWEFYELRSAHDGNASEDPATLGIPVHRADGSIEVGDATGIVFVLIPGGTTLHGAQSENDDRPNFDRLARANEAPQSVALSPYFLARHELTKGQWYRMSNGEEPSWHQRGSTYTGNPTATGWRDPVEQVSWTDARALLHRAGLDLPTEAQWEYGARGRTDTPWWTGRDASSLAGAANVLDKRAESVEPTWGRQVGDFDDGYVNLAPVGNFSANAFGLHDMHGNVWEWCADAIADRYVSARKGDGLRTPRVSPPIDRVLRGGSFGYPAPSSRCSYRARGSESDRGNDLGVRAARSLH